MDLLSLLVKEFSEWPSIEGRECKFIVQEGDRELYAAFDCEPVYRGAEAWYPSALDRDDGDYFSPRKWLIDRADDWQSAIITKEAWEAARSSKGATEAVAWSGEGLPPVGTICEWRDDDAGCWHKVEVRYLSKHTALLHFPGDGDGDGDTEGAFAPNYCQFRPLRTPDQIAAEERKKVIDKMVEDMAENMFELGCDYDRAVMLYEKGYRKDPHTADLLRALKNIATAQDNSTVLGLKQYAAGTLAAVEGGAQ